MKMCAKEMHAKFCIVLQIYAELCRVMQSYADLYSVMQSHDELSRAMQSNEKSQLCNELEMSTITFEIYQQEVI